MFNGFVAAGFRAGLLVSSRFGAAWWFNYGVLGFLRFRAFWWLGLAGLLGFTAFWDFRVSKAFGI